MKKRFWDNYGVLDQKKTNVGKVKNSVLIPKLHVSKMAAKLKKYQ